MIWTDDPVADYDRYDEEQAKKLDRLPKCDCCTNPIQDEHFYVIHGEYICESCMEEHYRRETSDYIKE